MTMNDLDILAGTWNTAGDLLATPTSPTLRLVATDTYRWLPGKHFLLHDVDARLGEHVTRSLEVIGLNGAGGGYATRSYDDQGGIEDFMATLIGRRWQIFGETVRFDGGFSENGAVLSGTWEQRAPGAEWARWMTIELRRADRA